MRPEEKRIVLKSARFSVYDLLNSGEDKSMPGEALDMLPSQASPDSVTARRGFGAPAAIPTKLPRLEIARPESLGKLHRAPMVGRAR